MASNSKKLTPHPRLGPIEYNFLSKRTELPLDTDAQPKKYTINYIKQRAIGNKLNN